MGDTTRLTWRVEGMDCAACVAKVTRAVERLPGVSDVQVNLMAERLTFALAPNTTQGDAIARQVEALGYTVAPMVTAAAAARTEPAHAQGPDCGHDHGADGHGHTGDYAGHAHGAAPASVAGPAAHGHDHDDPADAGKPWWRTGKAMLVWLLGGLVGGAYGLSLALPERLTYPLFLAATAVALVPFGRRAIALARAGSPFSIETLMVTAAVGAAIIGAAEEAAVVVLLFAVGELLENVAAGRARAGIRALADLMPRTALRLRPDNTTEQVPADRLAVGDLVLIRPGDRVPCDGLIEEGTSALDESPVTGESVPVSRGPGDPVVAGSINAEGAIRVRVTRAASDNTIARIIRMVEDATASRAPTQRFIERFSTWWTPGAMIVSLLVILLPPFLFGWDWGTSIYRGLAVLLIACPCALVISVPAAMASGLSAGARRGLLIKGGAALEAIGSATTVAFDKTGTLTEGRPRVTDVLPAEGRTTEEVLALAAAVEQGSSHPLAKAILAEAAARGCRGAGGGSAVSHPRPRRGRHGRRRAGQHRQPAPCAGVQCHARPAGGRTRTAPGRGQDGVGGAGRRRGGRAGRAARRAARRCRGRDRGDHRARRAAGDADRRQPPHRRGDRHLARPRRQGGAAARRQTARDRQAARARRGGDGGATASTTRRRWRRPMSAWRWAAARMSRWRPPTPPC